MTSKLRLSQRSNAEVSECSKGVWVTGGASCCTSCPDNHSRGLGEAGRAEERGEKGGGGVKAYAHMITACTYPEFLVSLSFSSFTLCLLFRCCIQRGSIKNLLTMRGTICFCEISHYL
jgi:hypothetical protein